MSKIIPLTNLNSSRDEKIRFVLWQAAPTYQEKTGLMFGLCDYCGEKFFSRLLKVFHTIDGKKSFTKIIDNKNYLSTTHIFVCQPCSLGIGNNYFVCKCKKSLVDRDKEDLCQLNH